MRLTLVISSLSYGGAERIAANMANYWSQKKWVVTLMTFSSELERPFYEIQPNVRRVSLNVAGESQNAVSGFWNNLKRVHKLRTEIKSSAPDAIISFMDTTNIAVLLATRGLKRPVLITEHLDPSMYSLRRPWAFLRFLLYRIADRLVFPSQRAADNYAAHREKARVSVIPNPVLLPSTVQSQPTLQLKRPVILGVGRLARQKGFDLLLRAFARLTDLHVNWSIVIFGEGPERQQLESLACELGLADRVSFPGVVKEIYGFLRQGDLFVLPSRYEGFGNVLVEAMACGLPVIAADCCAGPSEIVRHEVDGILVPKENVSALASAMNRLMSDNGERQKLGNRAIEVIERFDFERIMRAWEGLLDQVLRARRRRLASDDSYGRHHATSDA